MPTQIRRVRIQSPPSDGRIYRVKCQRGADRKGKTGATSPPHQTLYSYCTFVSHGLFPPELLVLYSFWPMAQNDRRATLWVLLLLCLIEMSVWSSLTKRRDGMVFYTGTLRTHWRTLLGVSDSSSYISSYGSRETSEQLVCFLSSTQNLCMCR